MHTPQPVYVFVVIDRPLHHYWLDTSVTGPATGEVMPVMRPWNAEEQEASISLTEGFHIPADAFPKLHRDQ